MRLTAQCAPPERDRVVIAAAGVRDTVVFGGARGRIWRGYGDGAVTAVGDLSGWVTCLAETDGRLVAGSSRGELVVVTDDRVRTVAVDAAILEIAVVAERVVAWDVTGRCWWLDDGWTPVETPDDFAPTPRIGLAPEADDIIELHAGGVHRIGADQLLAMGPDTGSESGLVALMLDATRAVLCTGSDVSEVEHWLPHGTDVPIMVVADRSGPTLSRLAGAVGATIRGVLRTGDGRLVARVERTLAGDRPVATWTTGLTGWNEGWVVCTGAATVVIRDGARTTRLDLSDYVGAVVGVVTLDRSRLLVCGVDGRTAVYAVDRGIVPAVAGDGCVVGARAVGHDGIAAWRRSGQVQLWREVAA